MKKIIIGDIHGRTNWKQIVEKEKDADEFIFMGDYFDPYDWTISLVDMVRNFNDILEFKIAYPTKVVMLIGNHDLAAFESFANKCRYVDGTYENMAPVLYNAIKTGVIKLCHFIDDNVVCSHAGFTKTWLAESELSFDEDGLNEDFRKHVEDKTCLDTYDFICREFYQDSSGNDLWQGPLWVRPMSLLQDMVDGFIQVVGHTRIRKNSPQKVENLLLADCLEHDEYYSYENNEFKYNKI